MKTVIVIGGTVDGREVIQRLLDEGYDVIATITTEFGKSLIDNHKNLEVIEGKLTYEDMVQLINTNKINALVDVSHPYAKNVSQNAIDACKDTATNYIRFERDEAVSEEANIIRVQTFVEAALKANELDGNILLTIGSNNIETFVKSIKEYKNRLFVRVLPDSKVITLCELHGLSANNIIAIKGPFSKEMNIETIKYCRATIMITKDSGQAGGTNEKLLAATEMGIKVIVVERPKLEYPTKVNNINKVVDFLKEVN